MRRNAAPTFRRARDGARDDARARRVHPDRAGHQRRGQQRPRPRARRRLHEDERDTAPTRRACARSCSRSSTSSRSQFVSKQQAYAQQSKADPQAYALLSSNPLPDTFHVIPDNPAQRARGPHGAAQPPGADARSVDPERLEQEERHEEDPRGHEPRDDHRGCADRAADDRLDPADREHDPALAVRAAPGGRGDEAGRRDRLVHPLAVRDRGHGRRRRRRAAGDRRARR